MKKFSALLLSLTFALLLFGCTVKTAVTPGQISTDSDSSFENSSSGKITSDPDEPHLDDSNDIVDDSFFESSFQSSEVDRDPKDDSVSVVRLNDITYQKFSSDEYNNEKDLNAYKNFSFEFFKKAVIEDASGNVCVSPASAFMALSLCFSGAQGKTLSEFENAIGLTKDDAMAFCRAIYARFLQRKYSDPNTKVNLANSVWIDEAHADFTKQEYLDVATNYFNAPVFKSDFKDPSTVNAINGWCNENTDGLIDKIIDELDESAVMALVNALLVEVNWMETYENTIDDNFFAYDGTEKKVTYLPRKIGVFYKDEDSKAFKISLSDRFSFVAILPDESVGIDEYVNLLTTKKIGDLLSNPDYSCDVLTRIPKFTTDYELDLKIVMNSMGITDAFSSEEADFKPMIEIPGENVFIGAAKQKTHFELDEKGIKAAAVTFIGLNAESIPEPKPVIDIYLNRPFVYMLVDDTTNLPLFIGVQKSI